MRSAGAPATSEITSLIRFALPSSTPFIRLTRVALGREQRHPILQVRAQRLRGDREGDDFRAGERLGCVGRRQKPLREEQTLQIVGILVRRR